MLITYIAEIKGPNKLKISVESPFNDAAKPHVHILEIFPIITTQLFEGSKSHIIDHLTRALKHPLIKGDAIMERELNVLIVKVRNCESFDTLTQSVLYAERFLFDIPAYNDVITFLKNHKQ